MKIYEFHNADNQAYLYGSNETCDRCDPNPPRSLAFEWSPPTLEMVCRDEFRSYLPKTDFPAILPTIMVLSARAVDRLCPILESCGEILPIYLSNDAVIVNLFNVTRFFDAVDVIRSQFLELPSGAIGPCEKLVLDPEHIPHDALFFKTTQAVPVSCLLATEAAVLAVKQARLNGYDFIPVWTDE